MCSAFERLKKYSACQACYHVRHLSIVIPAVTCRFAAKVIAKRWGPGAVMEPMFVRRVQHEVDISNHVGKHLGSLHSPLHAPIRHQLEFSLQAVATIL